MGLQTFQRTTHRAAIAATVLLGFSIPISTAANSLILLFILLCWLLSGNWPAKWARIRANPVALAVFPLVMLAAAGMLWGEGSTSDRWRYFGKYAYLLWIPILVSLPLSDGGRYRALLAFLAAMGLTLALSLMLYLGMLPEGFLPGREATNPTVFKLHITQGLFMGLAAFLAVAFAIHTSRLRFRSLAILFAALAVFDILILAGRIGYLAVAIAAIHLFTHYLGRRGLILALFTASVMAGLAIQLQLPAAQRIMEGISEIERWEYGSDDRSSMGLRMQYAATSIKIIAQHPLTGVGTGGFESAYTRQIASTAAGSSDNPHNQYLLTTAQLGIPGLMFLLLIGFAIWRSKALLAPAEALMAGGVLLILVAGNFFNSFLYDHSEVIFTAWFFGVMFSNLSDNRTGRNVRTATSAPPEKGS
jgi:O-antigen ligase